MVRSSALRSLQRSLFSLLSRTGVAVYSRFPIFGALRASVAVIRNNQLILVVERSDGRGLSLPGGFTHPWETPEQAVVRETVEETGLRVSQSTFLFEYQTTLDVPCVITVFQLEASGELHDSWEGSPRWLPLTEIRPQLLASQRQIIDRLLQPRRS
jgi:8-oxo-dGTP pyrophosphatase MutT (NUDIX family)